MVKAVLMTSFFESTKLGDFDLYSAAVYQPRGFSYPKIGWTDIREPSGEWIRPRRFVDMPDPALMYWNAMLHHYEARLDEARNWASRNEGLVVMCCWCPSDRAAKRQLAEHGSFICHTGPLGAFIQDRLGVPVFYDNDRQRMYHHG